MMAPSSYLCALAPAAFAAFFRLLSSGARSAPDDNRPSGLCERRSCEPSSIVKADAMGINYTLRGWPPLATLLERRLLVYQGVSSRSNAPVGGTVNVKCPLSNAKRLVI